MLDALEFTVRLLLKGVGITFLLAFTTTSVRWLAFGAERKELHDIVKRSGMDFALLGMALYVGVVVDGASRLYTMEMGDVQRQIVGATLLILSMLFFGGSARLYHEAERLVRESSEDGDIRTACRFGVGSLLGFLCFIINLMFV